MSFDHERLDVYQRALEVLDLCDSIIEQLPKGRAHLKDQLDRAATSIVLNVAEGAGEFSPDEKCRFYRIARRSATEAGAILHIYAREGTVPNSRSMRLALCSCGSSPCSCESRSPRRERSRARARARALRALARARAGC